MEEENSPRFQPAEFSVSVSWLIHQLLLPILIADARMVRGPAGTPMLCDSGVPCRVGSIRTSVGRDVTKKEDCGAPGGT